MCDSQNSRGNLERKDEELSRLEIGHKSNSLVLNQAAARLGQSLRETEDQLIRDMLEATASLINCVGGTNGRQNGFIAVLKSSLIDLELLAA